MLRFYMCMKLAARPDIQLLDPVDVGYTIGREANGQVAFVTTGIRTFRPVYTTLFVEGLPIFAERHALIRDAATVTERVLKVEVGQDCMLYDDTTLLVLSLLNNDLSELVQRVRSMNLDIVDPAVRILEACDGKA